MRHTRNLLINSIDRCSSCAALNGVDTAIINRADELVELSAIGEDLVAACATISKHEEEALKDAVRFFAYDVQINEH